MATVEPVFAVEVKQRHGGDRKSEEYQGGRPATLIGKARDAAAASVPGASGRGVSRAYVVVAPNGVEIEVSATGPHAAAVAALALAPGAGLVTAPDARDQYRPRWRVRLTAWTAPEWLFVIRETEAIR